jgi:hypothetical protein
MLAGLDLGDLPSPSRCFSCSITELAGGSGLSDQSCKVFGSEIFAKLSVRKCFAEVTVLVSCRESPWGRSVHTR